jgi:uncharacterized membrane protein (UPF0136 family)
MLHLTRIFFVIFALVTIAGGVIGFLQARSRASLIAGSIAGLLLLTASFLIGSPHPIAGFVLGLLASVMLAGKFIPDFIHKKALVPGGLMALLSAASIGLTLLAWYKK